MGSILAPFSYPNFIAKRIPKLIDFLIDFERILVPLGLPFGSQNLAKNQYKPPLEHRESLGACPGAWGLPKATQNGAQSEPWTPKIRSLGTPRPPKRSSRYPQNITKAFQNSFPKCCRNQSKFHSRSKTKIHHKSSRMYKNWKQKWIQHGAQLEPNFAARIWPNILKDRPQQG